MNHFNNPIYSDFRITSGDKKLFAHRVILDNIPYFHSLLSTQCRESLTAELVLSEDHFDLACEILHFTYTGRDSRSGHSFRDWLDILLLAELWQDFTYINLHIPIAVLLINDENDMLPLFNPSYQHLLTYFIRNSTFQLKTIPIIRNNISPITDLLISHHDFPLVAVLQTNQLDLVNKWIGCHVLSSSDMLAIRYYQATIYPLLQV